MGVGMVMAVVVVVAVAVSALAAIENRTAMGAHILDLYREL